MINLNYLTVKEAARTLRKRPATVREYIKKALLPAKRVGRDYLIAEADLRALLGK